MTAKNAQSLAHPALKTSPESGLFAKPQVIVSSAMHCWYEEIEVQQAIWELEQLDDDALHDIGLNRSEIEAYVRGHRA